MNRTRTLPCLLLTGFASCFSPSQPEAVRGPAPEAVELRGLPERYVGAFSALRDALQAHDDDVARRILVNLRTRIEFDGQRGVIESTRDPLEFLAGFERVLDGRERVQALALDLVLTPSVRKGEIAISLVARTAWLETLVLRPGPGTLRLQRTAVTPEGQELHSVRTLQAAGIDELVFTPGEVNELRLGSFPREFPVGSLAQRSRWSLTLRAGQILEEQASYPAMNVRVAAVEATDVAAFLPATLVEPTELARYAQEPNPYLPALIERAVRIHPDRRIEALDLLVPAVGRMTEGEVEAIVPALRWLARVPDLAGDPLAWKKWMQERSSGDRAASALDIGPR